MFAMIFLTILLALFFLDLDTFQSCFNTVSFTKFQLLPNNPHQNSKSVGTLVHINCEASKKIAKPRFTIITSMKVVGIIYQCLPPPYSAIKELQPELLPQPVHCTQIHFYKKLFTDNCIVASAGQSMSSLNVRVNSNISDLSTAWNFCYQQYYMA